VNVTVAVSPGVVWIGAQPDSSSPGTVTPYDPSNGRAFARPIPVGLPIGVMTVAHGALWVDAAGVTRVPFHWLRS
jgi:hypothetical protein